MNLPEIHRRLTAHPAFRHVPAGVVSLWLADTALRPVPAGECWDDHGAHHDDVRVWLPQDDGLHAQFAGLEALLGQRAAVAPRHAAQDGWLLLLPAAPLRQALRHEAALGEDLARWLADPEPQAAAPDAQPPRNPYDWLAAVALPAVLWAGLPQLGLSEAASSYLSAVSVGLWVWLRQLAPAFVGALLILAVLVLSGTVAGAVAFAGFADRSIFLLIGIFALGHVTQASGLAQRLTRMLLQRIPASATGYHGGLLGLGFLLTLILPSSAARIQLVSALTAQLGERFGAARSPFAHLAVAALSGATALSTVFLTSNPANFLVLGLLPEQWRLHFGWAAWAQASLGFLLPFLLGYGILFWRMTRHAGSGAVPAVAHAPAARWSGDEVVAASAIGLFAVGVAGINLHHIAIPLAALAVYLWLTSYGLLTGQAAQSRINWPMVLYLTAMIGLVRGFNDLGLEQDLSRALSWLPALAGWSPPVFLILLMAVTVLLRLFLPTLVCVSVLCAMLIPLTSASSVNPWLLAFVALTAAEGWFFPYQSSDYQLFRAGIGDVLDREHGQFIRLNAIVQAIKLLALVAAIPYWQWLGIL